MQQPVRLAFTFAAVAIYAPAFGSDSSQLQEQLVRVQQIQATGKAVAAILDDGSVVTWGDIVQVQQLKSTASAFAAVLEDGTVVTWGDSDFGGDSSHVQDHKGSVVAWGNPDWGGDSGQVQEQLVGVQPIQSTDDASVGARPANPGNWICFCCHPK